MQVELIQTITSDKLQLNGLLTRGDKDKPAVILLHGYTSDFFSHKFYSVIAEAFKNKGWTFLNVQHRGTGLQFEFLMPDGEGKYIGSHMELIEEAYMDIDAWVKYLLDEGYRNISIAGHSLGTIKAVRYLSEGEHRSAIKSLLLLCPFDKNGEVNLYTKGQWVKYSEAAAELTKQGKGEEYIPKEWMNIPLSNQTYRSWYSTDDLSCIFDFYRPDYTFPVLNNIEIPVHTIVGTKDEFFHLSNPEHSEEAMQILLKNLKHGSGKLIEGAAHVFSGYEQIVADEMLSFLDR